jgi:hypothetical protein
VRRVRTSHMSLEIVLFPLSCFLSISCDHPSLRGRTTIIIIIMLLLYGGEYTTIIIIMLLSGALVVEASVLPPSFPTSNIIITSLSEGQAHYYYLITPYTTFCFRMGCGGASRPWALGPPTDLPWSVDLPQGPFLSFLRNASPFLSLSLTR